MFFPSLFLFVFCFFGAGVSANQGAIQEAKLTLFDDLAKSADQQLHDVRILAKRARYAADAVVPVAGKPAKRFAKRMAEVQTVLGDHQDTAVAEDWLRAAAQADPEVRLAAGQLIAAERARRAELRAQWPVVWRKAAAKKKQKKRRAWPSRAR